MQNSIMIFCFMFILTTQNTIATTAERDACKRDAQSYYNAKIHSCYILYQGSAVQMCVTGYSNALSSALRECNNIPLDEEEDEEEEDKSKSIYRFWSAKNKSHFYTASETEKNYVIENYDEDVWKYEGIAYTIPNTFEIGMTSLTRFWSKKHQGHFYTASNEETMYVIVNYDNDTWKYEGVAYYVYKEQQPNTKPVYRFWSAKNKHHFYTASEIERDIVIEKYDDNTWKYEGVAWYVNE